MRIKIEGKPDYTDVGGIVFRKQVVYKLVPPDEVAMSPEKLLERLDSGIIPGLRSGEEFIDWTKEPLNGKQQLLYARSLAEVITTTLKVGKLEALLRGEMDRVLDATGALGYRVDDPKFVIRLRFKEKLEERLEGAKSRLEKVKGRFEGVREALLSTDGPVEGLVHERLTLIDSLTYGALGMQPPSKKEDTTPTG